MLQTGSLTVVNMSRLSKSIAGVKISGDHWGVFFKHSLALLYSKDIFKTCTKAAIQMDELHYR